MIKNFFLIDEEKNLFNVGIRDRIETLECSGTIHGTLLSNIHGLLTMTLFNLPMRHMLIT
jgi:hypothetical protein